MSRSPLRQLLDLAAAGRALPTADELAELKLSDEQSASVLAACRHAADLRAAGNHAAARSVANQLGAWFPGDPATLGQPPPVDPLAGVTDPHTLAAAVKRDQL